MAESLIDVTGTTVTHDETIGLQDGSIPAPPTEDNDDDDVLLSSIPSPFSSRLTALSAPSTAIGAAESAGNVVTFSPAGELGNIALTDSSGASLDGVDSGLDTADGHDILLYTDTANDNIVLGRAADDNTIVFAIYLEETGGPPSTGAKLWTVQYEAIDHGADGNDHDSAVDLTDLVHVTAFEANTFDFGNAPPGSNLFMAFGTTSQAIVVTGENPANQSTGANISSGDTVNTSGQTATSLGVNGQQVKAGEGMYFTFVSGMNANYLAGPNQNLTQNEADIEANIDFAGLFSARGAEISISQVNPGSSNTTTSLKITAYTTAYEPGTGFVDGLGDADDIAVTITGVTINGASASFSVSGEGVIVSGVSSGDVVGYTTSSDHVRVLVENAQPTSGKGSNISFDLGGFTLTQVAGDTDEIGSKIFFEDDGPAIDLTPVAEASIDVDESLGTAGSAKDEPGNAAPDDETAPGAPANALGYAVTAASALFSETADAGSDGEASKVYALVLTAGATGLTDTASGEAVVLVENAGVIEGRTELGNALVFTIAVDGTSGEVTTTQFRALDHGADGNDHDSAASMASGLVELAATLTDGDTDTASDKIELGSLIGFEDDGPAILVEDTSGSFSLGAQGDWTNAPGSDGFKSLSVTLNSYTIGTNATVDVDTSLGTMTAPDADGNYVFEGSITADFTNDGVANSQTVSFDLTFDPAADTYDLQFDEVPTSVVTFDTSQGSLAAGGPDAVQTLLFSGSDAGNDDVVFFGAVATAVRSDGDPTTTETPPNDILDLVVPGEPDLTEQEIEAKLPLPNLINASTQMNVSTSGIGINNNNLDSTASTGQGTGAFAGTTITPGDESFVVNPETLVDTVTVYISSTVQGYNTATEDLYYTVYHADGSVSGPLEVTAGMLTHYANNDTTVPKEARGGSSFTVDGGDKQIDAVQITMGLGTVKIPIIAFSVEEVFDPQPLDLDFTAELFDGDDDSDSDAFSIDLADGTV
ncbi:DUF5801 repeats-in-toxin domain-containing protein [Limimaricola soesokkakensis]|uniref:DUF5801 repeats-in-toxin domain-containing protein n=1 Tax=Limimaricola soesokkakensis TaxID=1343159 RepID=UPI003511F00E